MNSEELAISFGYMTVNEVRALKQVVSSFIKTHPVIVNIGAGSGTSGLAIAEANNDAIRYTVDSSCESSPLGGLGNEYNAFIGTGLTIPEQICGDSRTIGKLWNKKFYGATLLESPIDMIFIDDGHSYEDVYGDIISWTPNIIKGGVVAFHDYGAEYWPDVKDVVDQIFTNNPVIIHIDTLIAFRTI